MSDQHPNSGNRDHERNPNAAQPATPHPGEHRPADPAVPAQHPVEEQPEVEQPVEQPAPDPADQPPAA